MGISIRTLGRFSVLRDGQELTRFSEQPVRAALLVYLAVERDVTRDTAEGVVWSDLPPDRARHSLNQTLYRLRKDLGEDWLSAEGDRLRVSGAVRVDALDFEKRVETGDLPDALALYGGGFLEGWHLVGTSAFEHWTDRQRVRLSRLHREACRSHLSHLRDGGRMDEALELARAWVQRDPLEDEAHHGLIELLFVAGERAEALARYDAYERLLAEEELTPLDETRELIERLRDGHAAAAAPGDPAEESDPFPSRADRPRRTRVGATLAMAILILAVTGLLFGLGENSNSIPDVIPNRVLVSPLENRTGDPTLDPVGRLAADWITQGLASARFLEVLPSTELFPGLGDRGEERGVGDRLALGREMALENRAGNLVAGSYYLSGTGLEFHVQILDVPGGEVLESIGPVRSSSMDPIEAVGVLRQRVLISLALHRDESLGGMFTESALPPTYPAYLAYIEGARKMATGDWRGAAADLLRANELSPEFTAPLIYAAFAIIAGWSDYDRADSVARVVEASRATLPAYDRLRLDLLQATLAGDNPRAYLAVKEAAAIHPGASAHYSWGQRALELNRPREALEALSTWDPTRDAIRQWTPYWNVVTQAHHMLGNHERELEEAQRGRRQIPDRLETVWYEVRARAAMGTFTELNRLLEESLRMRWSPTINPGLVMYWASAELLTHGHSDLAETVFRRLEAWLGSLEEQLSDRRDFRTLAAQLAYARGEYDAAREVFQELLSREPGDPLCLRYLGAIAARLGNRTEAVEYYEALGAMDRPYLFGGNTRGQAVIAALLGNHEEAVSLLQRSVAEGLTFGTHLLSDPDLLSLKDYPPFQEFLRPQG